MRDYAMIYRSLCDDVRPLIKLRNSQGFAVRSQLRCFYKKLSPNRRISRLAEENSLIKFKAINSAISDNFCFGPEDERDHKFWMYLKRYIQESCDYLWGDTDTNLCVEDALEWISIGPGKSAAIKGEEFYSKLFDGDLSSTNQYIVALYRAIISNSGPWAAAEMQRSQRFGTKIIEGNKLFFVPKTTDVARACCTEPIINMMIQKVIGGFLESRLKRFFGISLEEQPDNNRELCRIGSLNRSFGTIDLKSASDGISWSLIQQLFPRNLVSWLSVSRSPSTTLSNGEKVELKMISTMGNGFNFPLMTLLFAATVRAVYSLHGKPCWNPKTQFGVFGDDIIVSTETYDDVIHFLNKLGFTVNRDKSFNNGPFRESCGVDYYDGELVRPVFIRSLETTSDVYSAINRLTRWSARQGIMLPKTISLLMGLVRFRPIPPQESDDAGIKVPAYFARPYNCYSSSYYKLSKVTRKKQVAESPSQAAELGYQDFNPDGWFTTYVGGFARRYSEGRNGDPFKVKDPNGFFSLRDPPSAKPRYKVIRASVPWWDWPGPHASRVRHDAWISVMPGYLE